MDKFMKKMQRFGGAMFTPTLLFAFAGIKTLDTGMMGALAIAGITIWLHNKYYDKELPDWIGIFRGSSLVVALGFFAMIPAMTATRTATTSRIAPPLIPCVRIRLVL